MTNDLFEYIFQQIWGWWNTEAIRQWNDRVVSQPSKFQGDFKLFKLDHTMFSCKATLLSAPQGILSILHFHCFCSLRASEDEIYFLCCLACLGFMAYEMGYLEPGCQCVHLFKGMPSILFLCMVIDNNSRNVFVHKGMRHNTQDSYTLELWKDNLTSRFQWICSRWTWIFLGICLQGKGRIAQSVKRLATGWTVRGSNPGGGRDFSHTSRPALRSTQPPVKWVPGLSRG
jgi:hypothetical protein